MIAQKELWNLEEDKLAIGFWHVTVAIAMYSASQELFDIVPRFFDFQDMREFPRYTLKPVTDCLESLQVPQSLSQKALRWAEVLEEINKPRLGAPLIYLRI